VRFEPRMLVVDHTRVAFDMCLHILMISCLCLQGAGNGNPGGPQAPLQADIPDAALRPLLAHLLQVSHSSNTLKLPRDAEMMHDCN
jgi:hypothetical protein